MRRYSNTSILSCLIYLFWSLKFCRRWKSSYVMRLNDYKKSIVVQLLSCVRLFVTLWTTARQASLSFTISQSLLKLMSTESEMPSNHLVLWHHLSSCLQSFSAQLNSVTLLCLAFCTQMDCSMSDPPCPSPEFTQTHAHPTISFSAAPFSSHLQSFPASGSFQMNQLFASGGQRIGASASASVLPMNIQDWFPLGLISLTSLISKELSRVLSSTIVQKHQFFSAQSFLHSKSHIHTWPLEKSELWRQGPLSTKWYFCFLLGCLGLS